MSRTSKLCPALTEAYLHYRATGAKPARAIEVARTDTIKRVQRLLAPLPISIPAPLESFEVEHNDVTITVTWTYCDQEYAFEGVGKVETLMRPYGAVRGGEEIVLETARGYGRKNVLLLEYTRADYFKDLRGKHGVAYAQREADEYIKRTAKWARDVVNDQVMDREFRVECKELDFFEYSEAFAWNETAEARNWIEDTLRYLLSRINHISS